MFLLKQSMHRNARVTSHRNQSKIVQSAIYSAHLKNNNILKEASFWNSCDRLQTPWCLLHSVRITYIVTYEHSYYWHTFMYRVLYTSKIADFCFFCRLNSLLASVMDFYSGNLFKGWSLVILHGLYLFAMPCHSSLLSQVLSRYPWRRLPKSLFIRS